MLALVGFLVLIGFAEIIASTSISLTTKSTANATGMIYLGILTIIVAVFIYENVSEANKKRRKVEKIEQEAYLKRKGELKAEKEDFLHK